MEIFTVFFKAFAGTLGVLAALIVVLLFFTWLDGE